MGVNFAMPGSDVATCPSLNLSWFVFDSIADIVSGCCTHMYSTKRVARLLIRVAHHGAAP